MLYYVLAFSIIQGIFHCFAWLNEPTVFTFIKFLSYIIVILVFIITWVVGKYMPTRYGLIIAVAVTVVHLVSAITNDLIILTFDEKSIGVQPRLAGVLMYSLIISPSLKYQIYYMVVFFINIA